MERCARSRNALSHVSAVNWITSSGRGEGRREGGREGGKEGREGGEGGRGGRRNQKDKGQNGAVIMTSVHTVMM